VRQRLQGQIKATLRDLAAHFIEKYEFPPMDRLQRRTFDGMVTWFCNHNVLDLLDGEDQVKLAAGKSESKDESKPKGGVSVADAEHLFVQVKYDGPGTACPERTEYGYPLGY
jgi:hypothetical protein